MAHSHSFSKRLRCRIGKVRRDPRRRLLGTWTIIAVVALSLVAAACGSGARPAQGSNTSFPNTAAGRQAAWLVHAVSHEPVPANEFPAHFDSAYLATLPAPAAATLNASWTGITGLRLDSISSSAPDSIVFVVTVSGASQLSAALGKEASVTVTVDAHGLIGGLHLQPAGATPPAPLPLPSASASVSASATSSLHQIPVGVGSPPLHATLTLPAGKGPFPAVVLVGGSGPGDQNESVGPNRPFQDIALGLAARGIASLRYDKRTRDYPQDLNPQTFTPTREYVPDALAAIHMLQHTPLVDPHRIFVAGHSQGGTYAPLIAKRAPQLAGVIMLAAGTESVASATLRQLHYLATLPGTIGAKAKAELPDLATQIAQIDSRAALQKDSPSTVLLGGAHPVYFLSAFAYNEVATARALPQPLLFLQGDRDYQCTVKNDLDVWLRGLMGRKGVTVVQFAKDDHLFLSGTGAPTPLDYTKPSHVDPRVIATIAGWIESVDRNRR